MIRRYFDAGRFSIAKSILCELMGELVVLFMYPFADFFSFVLFKITY